MPSLLQRMCDSLVLRFPPLRNLLHSSNQFLGSTLERIKAASRATSGSRTKGPHGASMQSSSLRIPAMRPSLFLLAALSVTFGSLPMANAAVCCQFCTDSLPPRESKNLDERWNWSPRGLMHEGLLDKRAPPPCCCIPDPGASCRTTSCVVSIPRRQPTVC